MNKRVVQDWEFSRETNPNEWETVDIQIPTFNTVVKDAQNFATKNKCRCLITTSLRYEENGHVEDRGIVEGDPPPILIYPKFPVIHMYKREVL